MLTHEKQTTMSKIRIIVADDHQLFRLGVKTYLEHCTNIEVIGEASGKEVVQLTEIHQPDLVLMDIDLKNANGAAVSKAILKRQTTVKILVLSSYREEKYIINMVKAGALGYVLKDAPMEELVIAIKALAGGNSYFSREVSSILFAHFGNRNFRHNFLKDNDKKNLTSREIEILKFIADELTNKEIANKLYISPRTVETHRRNLIQKLKVKNTVGLVKYYWSNNKQALEMG